jgi:hypothetical protein
VGAFGEKKKLCTVSLRPNSLTPENGTSFWSTIGRIVREIRFQSSFSEKGITGCTFMRMIEPSSSAP